MVVEIEDFLIDLLYLNMNVTQHKKTEEQVEQVVDHINKSAEQSDATVPDTNIDEITEDIHDGLPLILFAVCGSLTAVLLVFLRRYEQTPDKNADSNPPKKPTEETHDKKAISSCGDCAVKRGPQALVSPPPPPPSVLSTVPPPSGGQCVVKACSISPKNGESILTFRHYADLSKEDAKKPTFWCHYGYPGHFAPSPKPQVCLSGQVEQKPQSEPQQQLSAQQEKRLFKMLALQQQKDGHVEQQCVKENRIKILPTGDFIEMNENQDAGRCYYIHETPQQSGLAFLSAQKHQRQDSPRRSQQWLANGHTNHANVVKADYSPTKNMNNVTIDNFSEVMCMDTAEATFEDSYSQRGSNGESTSGSSSINHSNSLFKAKKIFRRARLRTQQNNLSPCALHKRGIAMSIGQNKVASCMRSKQDMKKNLAKPTVSPQINEMDKLANTLSSAPLISKHERLGPKYFKSHKNAVQKSNPTNCFLESSEKRSGRNLLRSFSFQRGEDKSHKCRNDDISGANHFKCEVAKSLHPRKMARGFCFNEKPKQQINSILNPFFTISSIETDNSLQKYPVADHLCSKSTSKSRRLVRPQSLQTKPPNHAHQISSTSRQGQWQQGFRRGFERKIGENKKLLSLNNSRTRENNNCIGNSRHFLKKMKEPQNGQQSVDSKELSKHWRSFQDKKLFCFGTTYPANLVNKAKQERSAFNSQCEQFPEGVCQNQIFFRQNVFKNLDHSLDEPNCFAGLIPEGFMLLNCMSQGLKDINGYYKGGFFSHAELPGGGVVRVCHHQRYCPYADSRRLRLPKQCCKVQSRQDDQRNCSSCNGAFEPLSRYPIDSFVFAKSSKFSREFETTPCLSQGPPSMHSFFTSNSMDFNRYGFHTICNSYNCKLPYTLDPTLNSGKLKSVLYAPKKQRQSPEPLYDKQNQMLQQSTRFWTNNQSENGKLLPVESKEKKGLSNIQRKPSFYRQNNQYTNQRGHIETAAALASSTVPVSSQSACRLACSRADSDTSKSRLLPMRPEIKSTDILRGNAKAIEPFRNLFTFEEESVTSDLFGCEENQLFESVSKVRQSKNSIGWAVLSDAESDGLFQVSEIVEMSFRDTSIKTLQSEAPSSCDYSIENTGQNTHCQFESWDHFSVEQSKQDAHSLQQNNKGNNVISTKVYSSPNSCDFSCDKTAEISMRAEFQSRESSYSTIPNIKQSAEVHKFCPVEHRMLASVNERSKIKLRENDEEVKYKNKARKLKNNKEIASTFNDNVFANVDMERNSHSTPSPNFVTRIVDAHRNKLYTHKNKPKLESPPKSKISHTEDGRNAPVKFFSKNSENCLGFDFNLFKPNTKCNTRGGRLSCKTSLSATSLTCGKGSLSLFGELTAAKRCNHSSSSPQFDKNKSPGFFGAESMVSNFRGKGNTKSNGLSDVPARFNPEDLGNIKPKIICTKTANRTRASFTSRGSLSSNKPTSRLSRKSSSSPSNVVFRNAARSMPLSRVNSSLPTWSSISPLAINMGSAQLPPDNKNHGDVPSPTIDVSKGTADSVKIKKGKRHKVGSLINTESTKTEIPHVSLNSLAARVTCKTLFSPEVYSSNDISGSPICIHTHPRKKEILGPSSENTKFSLTPLASEKSISKSQNQLSSNRSALSKRFQKSKSESKKTFSRNRETSRTQGTSIKQNNPAKPAKDFTSHPNLEISQAKKIRLTRTNENPSPVLVQKRTDSEIVTPHSANKDANLTINQTHAKNFGTLKRDEPPIGEQAKCKTKYENKPRGQFPRIERHKEKKITGREKGNVEHKSDFEIQNDIENRMFSSNTKLSEKLFGQTDKGDVSHNITGYHTLLRINRRQAVDKRRIENLEPLTPSGKRDEKLNVTRALEEPGSVLKEPQSSFSKTSQGLGCSKTSESALKKAKSSWFQQSASNHRLISNRSVRSPAGLFQHSRSNSDGRRSAKDPLLSPYPLFTYNKTFTSPSLNSEQVKSPSMMRRSDLTRSETFVSGRFFAANNSKTDESTRIGAKRTSVERFSKGEISHDSSLTHMHENAERQEKYMGVDSAKRKGRKTLNPTLKGLDSFVCGKDDGLQTKRSIGENKIFLPKKINGDNHKLNSRVPDERVPVPLIAHNHDRKKTENKSESVMPAKGVTQPENMRKARKKVNQQNKTRQFRTATHRTLNKSRALGTNNSAAVFPRACWGHMQCSEDMLVLRVPLDLLGLSNRTSEESQNSMQGLRGEGDGCSARGRITGVNFDESRIIPHTLNHINTEIDASSSFDWYRPAARTSRQTPSLPRYYRQTPRNSEQRDLDLGEISLTRNTIQVCHNASSGEVASVSASTEDRDHTATAIFNVSESQVLGRRETSSTSIENPHEVSDTSNNINIEANLPNHVAICQPILKSISCPDMRVSPLRCEQSSCLSFRI